MKNIKALIAVAGILLAAQAVKAATFAGGQLVETVASTATAAGTTTLVLASPHHQRFTGSTTQTVVLPSALTLKAGMSWVISNDSSGSVTVNQNGGSTISTLIGGEAYQFVLISAATPGGTWDSVPYGGAAISSLTGDVTATGPGAAAATIGASAVTSSKILDDTIVNADINSAAAISDSKLATISTAGKVSNSATTATAANTMSAIMARDASGQVAASTFTGNLVGNVTGNVTGNLTGDVTGNVSGSAGSVSGNASTATALAANPTDCGAGTKATAIDASGNLTCSSVANADLAGSIAASKLVGTDIATVGTITSGTWNGTKISEVYGGTNQATYTTGDILYASGANTLSKLAIGSASSVLKGGTTPSWGSVAGGDGVQQNLIGLDSSYVANNTTDRDAEVSVGNWTAYADAAGTAPVDMTGGSPNTTCTRSTSSPLDGAGHFLMTLTTAATRQGEGCSELVYIPPAYRGAMLELSFPFTTTGTITEDDIKLYAYDVTNSVVITPIWPGKILGAGPGKASAVFPISTTTAQLRVGLHIARASNTGAVTVLFDDVSLSPQVATYGLAGSNWASDLTFTPSAGFGTTSQNDYRYRRVGDSMQAHLYWKSGTVAASTASVALPSGKVIDSAKFSSTANVHVVGMWRQITTGGGGSMGASSSGPLFYDGSDTGNLYLAYQFGSNQFTKFNASTPFSNSDGIEVDFTIPIAGFDANVTNGSSSTFKISSYLASGSRVTGSAPTALGQYRSYLRNSSANTFTETNGTPGAVPSVADGIRIYNDTAWGVASSNNEPTRYDIFVGKNKNVKFEWYASAARTGFIDVGVERITTNTPFGYYTHYDPSTGIAVVTTPQNADGTSGHTSGRDVTNAGINDPYFDITVSENALAVQTQGVRSYVVASVGNGHGSGGTKIRKYTSATSVGSAITYTSDATNGDKFTINEDGVYSMAMTDGAAASSRRFGISLNAASLTAAMDTTLGVAEVLGMTTNVSGVENSVTVSWFLPAGSIIRAKDDSGCDFTGAANSMFRIVKVSN